MFSEEGFGSLFEIIRIYYYRQYRCGQNANPCYNHLSISAEISKIKEEIRNKHDYYPGYAIILIDVSGWMDKDGDGFLRYQLPDEIEQAYQPHIDGQANDCIKNRTMSQINFTCQALKDALLNMERHVNIYCAQ